MINFGSIGGPTLIALLNNAALLLVLFVIYEVVYFVPSRYRRLQPVFSGLLIALICVAIMSMPFTLRSGVIFDTRSILLSVTALTFGLIPTGITVATAAIFRLIIGGAGTLAGIVIIMASALIGLAWRRWLYPYSTKWRWLSIYAMGVSVHVIMLASMLLLPSPDRLSVIREIGVPVMTIFPIASVLLSLLLMRQQDFRHTQDQLEQSEERFKLLFDKAPLGYQSLDADGYFIEVNQQWLDLLGYRRDEVIGKWFGDFLAPAYKEAFKRNFSIFKAQGHIHSEFEMLHKSSKSLFISFEGKIGSGLDGAFKQTHCILQDITEQRVTEEALRLSEENHRRLFETMAQGVVYQAADGSIISANPAAERILGMTFDQMEGKTSLDPNWKAIKEDGSEMTGSEHPSMVALRTGKPWGPITMGIFQPRVNDHVWISINAVPLFQPGETAPFQVYTTFQDITAERKAEQNYQLLFSRMVDGFALHEIICDDQGKPVDYRFLVINQAFETMTGLQSTDILGKTVLEVLPDTEPHLIETYGRVALTGEPTMFKHYSTVLDKHFEISAYQPAPNQFAVTFSDVTEHIRAEEKAMQNLSRLRSLLDNSPSPIVIIDESGKFVEVSAVAEKIIGLPKEEIYDKEITQVAPPVMAEKALYVLSQSSEDGQYLEYIDEFEFEGNKRYFESRIFPIHVPSNDEKLFGYLGIDVTDRLIAENALKESDAKYRSYIENAPNGVFVLDEKGRHIDANQAVTTITGFSREELSKMSIQDITPGESHHHACMQFEILKKTGSMSSEFPFLHRKGLKRWWSIDAVKLSENRYLGFASDITERKSVESKMLYLSQHDHLTGLYNRRFFEEELVRMNTKDNLPLSVIICDVNGLKMINDSFGNDSGDMLLKYITKTIKLVCREGDIIARHGGDEFVILLPKTTNNETIEIASRIKELAAKHMVANIELSISYGCCTKTTDKQSMIEVIANAENHMHRHKLHESASMRSHTIDLIMSALFEKSNREAEHSSRVSSICQSIATQMDFNTDAVSQMKLVGLIHDIGKIGVREKILNKPGSLTDDERREVERHPEIGWRLLSATDEFSELAQVVLNHHEKWDGSGYPNGLKGEDIPLEARIISVADAYDAMTSERTYRKGLSREEAFEELKTCSGTQFDPGIVDVFVNQVLPENSDFGGKGNPLLSAGVNEIEWGADPS